MKNRRPTLVSTPNFFAKVQLPESMGNLADLSVSTVGNLSLSILYN